MPLPHNRRIFDMGRGLPQESDPAALRQQTLLRRTMEGGFDALIWAARMGIQERPTTADEHPAIPSIEQLLRSLVPPSVRAMTRYQLADKHFFDTLVGFSNIARELDPEGPQGPLPPPLSSKTRRALAAEQRTHLDRMNELVRNMYQEPDAGTSVWARGHGDSVSALRDIIDSLERASTEPDRAEVGTLVRDAIKKIIDLFPSRSGPGSKSFSEYWDMPEVLEVYKGLLRVIRDAKLEGQPVPIEDLDKMMRRLKQAMPVSLIRGTNAIGTDVPHDMAHRLIGEYCGVSWDTVERALNAHRRKPKQAES